MGREQFLWELRARLEGALPSEYLEEVMAYYAAYFDDAGPEREAEVVAGLGAPIQVARQILGEAALRDAAWGNNCRGGLKTLGLVLLAIFASPIAIPLAILVAAAVCAVTVVILAITVGLAGTGAAFGANGVFSALAGFGHALSHWPSAIYLLGRGMISAGVGVLFVAASLWFSGAALGGVARVLGRVLRGKRRSG